MTAAVSVTVYYPRIGTAHDLQANALFCLSNFGFFTPEDYKLQPHCNVYKMSCSKQPCRNRKCTDCPSILHFVSHTYHLCTTTSWAFVSLCQEGKVLWTTQETTLAGWVPLHFCMGDTWHLHRWKIPKWKRHRNSAFWRASVSTEVVFCPYRAAQNMKERSGSGLQISVTKYSPVKIYTASLCSFYLRIINPN